MSVSPAVLSPELPAPRRLCRTCYWWKRRDAHLGTCWQADQCGITVEEHDVCPHHEPKVWHVEHAPEVHK